MVPAHGKLFSNAGILPSCVGSIVPTRAGTMFGKVPEDLAFLFI